MSDDDDIPDLVEKSTGKIIPVVGTTTPSAAETVVRRAPGSSSVDPKTGRDREGFTELHWAVFSGDVLRVTQLVKQGKWDVNDCDNSSRQSPLLWAAVSGNVEAAWILVSHGANLHHLDMDGFSAANLAVQNGHVLLLHVLLCLNADPNQRDQEGHTLLHWAVYRSQHRMAQYLLRRCEEREKNGEKDARRLLLDASDAHGATAMHWACMRSAVRCAEVLLEHGADAESNRDQSGKTALQVAESNGDARMLHLLETVRNKRKNGEWSRPAMWWAAFLGTLAVWIVSMWITSWSAVLMVIGLWMAVASGHVGKHLQGYGGFRSSVPFGAMCATCAGVFYYQLFYLMPSFPDMTLTHITFWLSMFIMFASLYPVKRDPGIIRNTRQWSVEELAHTRPDLFCPFCIVRMPIRAHHCRRCNQCVARFDHHCPWIDGCIGDSNNKYFVPMVGGAAIGHVIFFFLTWWFLRAQYSSFDSFYSFWNQYSTFSLFWVTQIFQMIGEFLLLYGQMRAAMADVTTWELIVLTTKRSLEKNPFDRGTSMNLKQFFGLAGPKDQINYLTKFEGQDYSFQGIVEV